MIAAAFLSVALAHQPVRHDEPRPRALVPPVVVIRDPRMPLVGRRARRREAALARKA